MAENKNSFVLYADLRHIFDELTDEEAGVLIKHIFSYVNDENPITNNRIISISFQPIKAQLKRDLVKWNAIKEKRSAAGKASAEAKKNATKSTSVESVQQTPTKSTVNGSVSVNVNVSEINNKNAENGFDVFWSLYPKKVEKDSCRKIYAKLSIADRQKISETISAFLSFKPFPEYNHPNPKTYLNKKRWNDELPTTKQPVKQSPI